MDVTTITLLSIFVFLGLLILGIQVWSVLLGVGLIFLLMWRGSGAMYIATTATVDSITKDVYIAIPGFVLMAFILQHSGVATDLYDMMYKWFAGLRGGLAIGTVVMCVFISAMTGSGATGVVIMGTLGLPEMLRRGYRKDIAVGVIPPAGALGPVIPPSITVILLGGFAEVPIGPLFVGSILPGLLIAGLYICYLIIRCYHTPALAPALGLHQRASWKEKLIVLRGVALPLGLIFLVIGSLYLGVATPSEAGCVGAFGAYILALSKRHGSWQSMKPALIGAVRLTAMLMWCLAAAKTFSHFLTSSGISGAVGAGMLGLPFGILGITALFCAAALIMGMFIEIAPIIMITVPIIMPVIHNMGIDPIWFLIVYNVALCVGYFSPPFGMNLFYTVGVLPKDSGITMGDIYRGVIPYCILNIIALVILLFFPIISTILPTMMRS